jgi:hypothetical protein
MDSAEVALSSPIQVQDVQELSRLGQDVPEDEDMQELASVGSETNGMTFARRRKSQTQEDEEESVSELSMRPAPRIPGTPESNSIPDDTPSIQVGASSNTYVRSCLTAQGLHTLLSREQCTGIVYWHARPPTDLPPTL